MMAFAKQRGKESRLKSVFKTFYFNGNGSEEACSNHSDRAIASNSRPGRFLSW